jgi:ABC-type polysaccharide transport system, permease component
LDVRSDSILQASGSQATGRRKFNWRKVKINWQLYVLLSPALLYFLIFKYYPMYGVQIAFKDFRAVDGILGSKWVGFKHFQNFFDSYYFWTLIKNTLGINLYALALFPISIIVALSLNELRDGRFKKIAQTITYAPHFISVVVFCGMIIAFLDPETGIVNNVLKWLGFEPIRFMESPAWFKSIYVWSNEWQNLGWGAIIYLAALAGIDPQLHEAAKVDGATRLQRIWHINLPGIMPTIIILLILNMGNLMSIGFEKILLLQNDLNLDSSQVIQTYVYNAGLLHGQYSYSTAVGLFNSVVNFILLVTFNQLARRTGTSLW